MKKIILLIALLIPVAAHGSSDYRDHNLDSLELVAARYTPDKLASASKEELVNYAMLCRELTWGYLQLDATKCTYYGRQAIRLGEQLGGDMTVFDASILVGQTFWIREQYDSAGVYYNKAAEALARMEADWPEDEMERLDANRARLWGTMGNFYAMQDSLEQTAKYYGMAGEVFDRIGEYQQNTILHYNMAEIYLDAGEKSNAKAEYDRALSSARQSGDSLIIAHALYGLGRWYHESGKTAKALDYLTQAEEYFGEHAREESFAHANTLAIMNAAHEELYRNARMLAIGAFLILLLSISGALLIRRLRLTKQELTETSAVLDETIEELAPTGTDGQVELTNQEKAIAKLLVEGKSTKEIAEGVHLGVNTVFWYRKRLYAKFGVHSAAAFASEMIKRGLV